MGTLSPFELLLLLLLLSIRLCVSFFFPPCFVGVLLSVCEMCTRLRVHLFVWLVETVVHCASIESCVQKPVVQYNAKQTPRHTNRTSPCPGPGRSTANTRALLLFGG